jgi:hypothetical protein
LAETDHCVGYPDICKPWEFRTSCITLPYSENSPWEILHNAEVDNPFFTSDYPAAIETSDLNTPINRVVPLTPDIAIRIRPDIKLSGTTPDLTFPKFSATPHKLKFDEVANLNRLLVQCAEGVVLYRDEWDWIDSFVAKNRCYRVEPVTQTLSRSTGDVLVDSTDSRLCRRRSEYLIALAKRAVIQHVRRRGVRPNHHDHVAGVGGWVIPCAAVSRTRPGSRSQP